MNSIAKIDPDWAWAPFDGSDESAWDDRRCAHLFRRSGFGANRSQLDSALTQRPTNVIDDGFGVEDVSSSNGSFQDTAETLAQTVVASGDARRLSAAWVYRLLGTNNPLREKMTIFWHGHFATSAEKVQDARMMWNQNRLLRQHALGDFSALVEGIAKDPAMLIYLDSAMNRKAHPNENFARELMELFCLGEGMYSESDVQELARCFTGWEIKNKKFRKNRYQQDQGDKSILGHSGPFDGEDGVRIVLEQPSTELFLARKWYRYLISDEPDPPDSLLQPLADIFRLSELQIAPVLKVMLSSNLFFSDHAIGRRIKSPVELVVGSLRCLDATTNVQLIAEGLLDIGQGLFYPPNVKGWEGGRDWINSSTLLGRSNLMASILSNENTRFGGSDLVTYLKTIEVHGPDQAIDCFARLLLPIDLSASTRDQLITVFEQSGKEPERQYRSLLHAFVSLPQCQLG